MARTSSRRFACNCSMSGQRRAPFASRIALAALPLALIGASGAASAEAERAAKLTDPMRFFEGRTEGVSTVKVVMKKAYTSRTIGRGEIENGVLNLVQRVNDEGRSPFERRWTMRQVAPGRFTGAMSEAVGPVTVDEVGGRFRFRFRMKGNLSIEQWLTPLPGGREALSKISIRKFGMTVGRSDGTIRKL